MNIAGIQKLTLLDYPGFVACTVFTGGCNFRCPFCHNAELVVCRPTQAQLTEKNFWDFLESRRGLLDGVVISGGEPLLQDDLASFLYKIKEKGLRVKLDTNGSLPERLRMLTEKGLLDWHRDGRQEQSAKICPHRRYCSRFGGHRQQHRAALRGKNPLRIPHYRGKGAARGRGFHGDRKMDPRCAAVLHPVLP